MSRLIDADLLDAEIKKEQDQLPTNSLLQIGYHNGFTTVRAIVLKQPTVELESLLPHGRWVQCFEDWRQQIEGEKCSVCGFEHYGAYLKSYRYCPDCGARMDGDQE